MLMLIKELAKKDRNGLGIVNFLYTKRNFIVLERGTYLFVIVDILAGTIEIEKITSKKVIELLKEYQVIRTYKNFNNFRDFKRWLELLITKNQRLIKPERKQEDYQKLDKKVVVIEPEDLFNKNTNIKKRKEKEENLKELIKNLAILEIKECKLKLEILKDLFFILGNNNI